MIQRSYPKLLLNIVFSGLFIAVIQASPTYGQPVDFDRQVAPILVSHCLECHRAPHPEGGLRLDEVKLAMHGGDSGLAIRPGKPDGSVLWERVAADEMPPKHPLSENEKQTLKQWIKEGAKWGTDSLDMFSMSTSTRAGRDWWSLQPLRNITAPASSSNKWGRNEIDAFVLKTLQSKNLTPASEASPRNLIRRLYFDLIGLPPTAAQVDAFAANPTDAAYKDIVDQLLASKQYGERWGRHWLDVVRFGESDGFERNFQRENAWYYRDWVIQAINDDMPYDEFVRMQLIGDQLTDGIDGPAATGFWVAGVHNKTVGGSDRMKKLAREDEIEEVLATVGQTFLGLTINCARCHDHKFDPITQAEYYQMASAISGLGFGERTHPLPQEIAKLRELEQQLNQRQSQLATNDSATRKRIISNRPDEATVAVRLPTAMARWEFDHNLNDSEGNLHGTANGKAHLKDGALILDGNSFVETPPIESDIAEKTLETWVQLDNIEQHGGSTLTISTLDGRVFDAIVFAERDPGQWLPGSNSFQRTDSFQGAKEQEAVNQPVHFAIVYQKDGTITSYRNGLQYGRSVRKADLQPYKAGGAQILFGLRHKPAGGNRFLKAKIHRAAFYNVALTPAEIAAAAGNSATFVSETELSAALNETERSERQMLKSEIKNLTLKRDRQKKKANPKLYTLTAGRGQTTNILLRGDPDFVGDVVSPGATSAVNEGAADFGLKPDGPEPQRRKHLAEWITHADNPLLTRVITNRIWHYHFGTGIVDTPNDFGFNGGRPSHPELLDYLAGQLQQHGYRTKWLHRLIVNSSTYRQASHNLATEQWEKGKNVDSDNRLLWRGTARRLEAESLRDAILSVSGQLNTAAGGPGFKDVSITLNNGTTYYEPQEVDGAKFFRRTVYRFSPRGSRSALLDTFDCPDPATTAPRRSVTTTPLQSLSLMNNTFVLQMANYFAQRIESEGNSNTQEQVIRAWQLAIARKPNESEQNLSEQLVTQHGLSALCRGLFNYNEFVLID